MGQRKGGPANGGAGESEGEGEGSGEPGPPCVSRSRHWFLARWVVHRRWPRGRCPRAAMWSWGARPAVAASGSARSPAASPCRRRTGIRTARRCGNDNKPHDRAAWPCRWSIGQRPARRSRGIAPTACAARRRPCCLSAAGHRSSCFPR